MVNDEPPATRGDSGYVDAAAKFVKDNVLKPYGALLAASLFAFTVAIFAPIREGFVRGWNAAFYGSVEEQGESEGSYLPPDIRWVSVPFQNSSPCLTLIEEWAKENEIEISESNQFSIVLEKEMDKVVLIERVSCIVPVGADSSVAIFSGIEWASSSNLSNRERDYFIGWFAPWLLRKLDSGKYFDEKDKWYELPSAFSFFMAEVEVGDKETELDLKYRTFPRKVLKAFEKTSFNHVSCRDLMCTVGAPDASIVMYLEDGEVETEAASPNASLNPSRKRKLFGTFSYRIEKRLTSLSYSSAQIEEMLTNVPGVRFVGAF